MTTAIVCVSLGGDVAWTVPQRHSAWHELCASAVLVGAEGGSACASPVQAAAGTTPCAGRLGSSCVSWQLIISTPCQQDQHPLLQAGCCWKIESSGSQIIPQNLHERNAKETPNSSQHFTRVPLATPTTALLLLRWSL